MSEKLDPRTNGKELANKLESVYQSAFDEFAGPPEFRHSCNYNTYHRAALLAVYSYAIAQGEPQ